MADTNLFLVGAGALGCEFLKNFVLAKPGDWYNGDLIESSINLLTDPPERGRWIAPPLVVAMEEVLAKGEQSLLFLNRRGYAPLTLCRTCGHRFQCPNCTAWMVEHRLVHRLACHHCGHVMPPPRLCPECDDEDSLVACGPGVERVADEVALRFPEARTAIVTSDTLWSPAKAAEFRSQATGEDRAENRDAAEDQSEQDEERRRAYRSGEADPDHAEDHADEPAHEAHEHRLGQELAQDVALARTGGDADADLARAFAHRHQHHVHHADAAHHQGDGGNQAQHHGHALAGSGFCLNACRRIANAEILTPAMASQQPSFQGCDAGQRAYIMHATPQRHTHAVHSA